MPVPAELDVAIDTFEARIFATICEKRLNDLANVAAVESVIAHVTNPDAPVSGGFRLAFCRTHKAYHLYTGKMYSQISGALLANLHAIIRDIPTSVLPDAAREAARARIKAVHLQATQASVGDRARFSDWKTQWHEANQAREKQARDAIVAARKQRNVEKAAQQQARAKVRKQRNIAKAAAQQARVAARQQPNTPTISAKREAWAATVDQALTLMSPIEQAEFYRCARKHAYAFRWQAERAIESLGAIPGRERMSAYSCEFCSGWHMGHSIDPEHGGRQVDERKAHFALMRYVKPAQVFFTEKGIDVRPCADTK